MNKDTGSVEENAYLSVAKITDLNQYKMSMANKQAEKKQSQKNFKEKRREMLELLVDTDLTEDQVDLILKILKGKTKEDSKRN
jgi:translation initiation factor IF-3